MRPAPVAGLLLLLACGSTALSADITTVNGTVYRDARVTTVDPDGIHVVHKFGVAKIPFEELSEALRAKYHYDKQKADAYRVQVSARRRASAKQSTTTQQQAQAAQQTKALQSGSRDSVPKGPRSIFSMIMSIVVLLGIIGLAIALYFLPSILGRRKPNAGRIFLLNLLLGWTFAGWVRALIWALSSDPQPAQPKNLVR